MTAPARPLPPPSDITARIGALVTELAAHLGERSAVEHCVALLEGADRGDHLEVLPYLTGFTFGAGETTLDPAAWPDLWLRTWGARGLLYVWAQDPSVTRAVVAGVRDAAWRPAEMCVKVAALRELGEAGPGAVALASHALPRVRAQAIRFLGVAGDTEHVDVVRTAAHDPDPAVRSQAARARERMERRLDLRF